MHCSETNTAYAREEKMLATLSECSRLILALAASRTKAGFPCWPITMAASILVSHINVSHTNVSHIYKSLKIRPKEHWWPTYNSWVPLKL